jgi:mRNA interferase MazF
MPANSPPQRGEISLVQLDPTRGKEIQKTRPALVISADVYAAIPLWIVAPITTWQARFASWPYMIPIPQAANNGLARDSAANVLQVRSVALERLTKRLGVVTDDELRLVVAGVALSIDYVPPPTPPQPPASPPST